MRYAILYSGHLRTLLDTIDNHKKCIVDYDMCDVYLNLWDGWGNGYVLKEYQFEDSDLITDKVKNFLIEKIKPKFYEFQIYSEVHDEISEVMKLQETRNNSNKIRNVISMYYKLQRGFTHIKNSGIEYDGILRIRPDTFLINSIELFKPKKNTLYTSLEPRWCLNGNGVNDQLGFGDMDTMYNYCGVYSELCNMWTNNIHLGCAPEVLLKLHLDNFSMTINDIKSGEKWNGVQLQRIMRENKILD
jgi:hypothetical protein